MLSHILAMLRAECVQGLCPLLTDSLSKPKHVVCSQHRQQAAKSLNEMALRAPLVELDMWHDN